MYTIDEKEKNIAESKVNDSAVFNDAQSNLAGEKEANLAEDVVETVKKSVTPTPTDLGATREKTKNDNSAQDLAEDTALEDYQQLSNYKDVLFNDLVGDFDEFGEYQISEDIMQDLIDMPKKIDYIDEAGIHARGFLGDHTFAFLVTKPQELENGDAVCYLKLDEQIDRMAGFQFDILTSTIATYCYHFDELYDQFVRDVFHLREYESDDTGEEGRKYRADFLASRYDLFYTMRACSEDYYEKLEEIYFNHRMLMLGMDPELTLLMAEFNKKRVKLEPYLIISRRRFFFMNQLLDEVLQMHAERLNKSEIAERMEQLDAKYIEKSKEIKQKTLENPKVAELMPKVSNTKAEVKFVASKKSTPTAQKKGVSKGGGDKPKSKAKKKGGKSGGKPKSKGKDKPKVLAGGGFKGVSKPSSPDLVMKSFAETIKEMGGESGELFGHMRM